MGYNNGFRVPAGDLQVVSVIGDTEPVTLAEAKNYLRVTNTQDDTLITNMITQARVMAEIYLNSDIIAKQRRVYFEYLDDPINLYYAPITSVDEVTFNDVEQVEDEGYEVQGLTNPKISIQNVAADKVAITYTTAGRDEVGIKQGVLCAIAYLYHGRTDMVNTNYKSFLSPYKIYGYYGTR